MANVKMRAFVQKFGTHGVSTVLRGLAHHEGPTTREYVNEIARELSEALEEVLHEDPESGH